MASNEGTGFVFLGGGREQEELAGELRKKGYPTTVVGYKEGLEVGYEGGLEASVRRCDEALANSIIAVNKLREYSDPVEFGKVYQRVLENQSINLNTFWDDRETQNAPREHLEFFEGQINEYKGLKKLLLQVYLSKKEIIDINTEKLSSMVNPHKEVLGEPVGGYAKSVTNFLAFELIKASSNRGLSEAEKLNDRVDELNQEGRYEEALPYSDRALKLSPRFCLAYINKGIALKNLGRFDKAIACYDKVINELDSKYKKAWYNKAVVLQKKGKISEAIKCVDRALEICPAYPHAIALKSRL